RLAAGPQPRASGTRRPGDALPRFRRPLPHAGGISHHGGGRCAVRRRRRRRRGAAGGGVGASMTFSPRPPSGGGGARGGGGLRVRAGPPVPPQSKGAPSTPTPPPGNGGEGRKRYDRMSDVRVAGLSHSYAAGTPALDGVTFHVPAGASVGVVGPNGAGKT